MWLIEVCLRTLADRSASFLLLSTKVGSNPRRTVRRRRIRSGVRQVDRLGLGLTQIGKSLKEAIGTATIVFSTSGGTNDRPDPAECERRQSSIGKPSAKSFVEGVSHRVLLSG
ncbi:MAG: hypothetical protein AB1586_33170 [Pseudomonadota bacterium]